jgi:mRNA interferase RelE/StbE
LKTHEDVRKQYEALIKELLAGEHPEKMDVKRIKGKRADYYT